MHTLCVGSQYMEQHWLDAVQAFCKPTQARGGVVLGMAGGVNRTAAGGVAPPLPLPPPAHVPIPVGSTLHSPEQQSELAPQALPKGWQLTVAGGGVEVGIVGGVDRTGAGGVAPATSLGVHVPPPP